MDKESANGRGTEATQDSVNVEVHASTPHEQGRSHPQAQLQPTPMSPDSEDGDHIPRGHANHENESVVDIDAEPSTSWSMSREERKLGETMRLFARMEERERNRMDSPESVTSRERDEHHTQELESRNTSAVAGLSLDAHTATLSTEAIKSFEDYKANREFRSMAENREKITDDLRRFRTQLDSRYGPLRQSSSNTNGIDNDNSDSELPLFQELGSSLDRRKSNAPPHPPFGHATPPATKRAHSMLDLSYPHHPRQDSASIFKTAVRLHTTSQGSTQNILEAKGLYEVAKGDHAGAMNNLAVILQTEDGSEAEVSLRRAVELYELAISTDENQKAMANLALLLWRGTKYTTRNVTRGIELMQKAVDIGQLARNKVLLARMLLSTEVGSNRDAVRARSLLEEAVREAMFVPAMRDLTALLLRGDVGVPRDAERANRLDAVAQRREGDGIGMESTDDVESPQLVLWEESREVVEERLREAKVRQSQCFLLTLGGPRRGKTSVVRSLRGMPFIQDHDPTELASLTRFQVIPGGRQLSEEELEELVFKRDSLTANLSRSGGSMDPVTRKERETVVENMEEGTTGSLGRSQGGSEREGLSSQQGRLSSDAEKRDFTSVFSRVSNGFSEKPLPAGTDGALVQCWDMAGQSLYMMAHALFVRNGNIFVFVVNLKSLWDVGTRLIEIRELCRWMQLVHALVAEPRSVRPIIVGTYKDNCDDIEEVRRILYKGLQNELGEAVYDMWIKVDVETGKSSDCEVQFVSIENSRALDDAPGSGLKELEEKVKRAAEGIVEARQEVPARWLAFVEELERSNAVFLDKRDVSRWVEGFPAFHRDREVREDDSVQALRYFCGLGRLVLFELSEGEMYVFPRPSVILEFVRRVTGREESVQKGLGQEHAKMLDKGLLREEGLKALWHGHSDETRGVMLDLLCRFDLLMRLRPAEEDKEEFGELIGIPALLPKASKGLRWVCRVDESELRASTKFTDAFPPGLVGCLISHLHKKIGGGRTRAGFLGSDVAILTSRVELQQKGRVMVAFVSEQRRIEWRVLAEEPIRVMQGCLKALEEFLDCPLRGVKMSRTHCLMTKCESQEPGCGREWAVEFPLPTEWVRHCSCEQLPNLEGECSVPCEELWTLSELLPNVCTKRPGGSVEAVEVRGALSAYDVFISHAGPDKPFIARPLFNDLRARGMHCFLDKVELEPGDPGPKKMTTAMETADIAVLILSPEFAARRWTMRELRCFLRRWHEASSRGRMCPPIVIPVFYRLSIQECRNLDPEQYNLDDGSNLFVKEGFYDADRQEEAPTEVVKDRMKAVTGITGIENEEGASNDMSDAKAAEARSALINRIAGWVTQHHKSLNESGDVHSCAPT